jgi:hypothetical protein
MSARAARSDSFRTMTETLLVPTTTAGGDEQPPRLTLVPRSEAARRLTAEAVAHHEDRRPKVTAIRTASAHGSVVPSRPLAA